MLGLYERLLKQQRQREKFLGGGMRIPKYPGSLEATQLKAQRHLGYKLKPNPCMNPMRDWFEGAKRGAAALTCFSYPVRFGKTELLIQAIVDRLLYDPSSRICYLSYGAKFAAKKSARMRQLAIAMGVPIDPTTRSKQDWATGVGEGGVWATSVGGSINGMGFDLIIADDLIGGWEDAYSAAKRDLAWDMLIADAMTRRAPEASAMLNGTRWHPNDPIGRAIAEGWAEVNVPAINKRGESNWPEQWPAKTLIEGRDRLYGGDNGIVWSALYMGKPRSDSDCIFRSIGNKTDEIPLGVRRVVIGVDFAYTVEKYSDYSVAVVLAEIGGLYYVLDVHRARKAEADFRADVGKLKEKWEASHIAFCHAATEKPLVELMNRDGITAIGVPAIKSKKVRALATAAAWNVGHIKLLGSESSWMKPFLDEVLTFTGADRHDDQVDALTTAFNELHQSAPIDWDYVTSMNTAAPAAFSLTGCN